jgi:tight adherence protein C
VGVTAVFLFVGVFAAAYALAGRTFNLEDRIRLPGSEKSQRNWRETLRKYSMIFKPLGEMLPRSPEEMSRQERRLMMAGIRRKEAPAIFYGAKLGAVVVFLILFAVSGFMASNMPLALALSLFLGALAPDIWLTMRSRARKERIQLALPDVMDLTVVCVEAGLGLDQALLRIGQEISKSHPDISDELRLFNLEVNAGQVRAQALRNLAKRSDVEDLKALVAVLIQTDRFGTSIAQSLRVFADSSRTKRRQRAEERAAKTTIKMIPPLVFLILPAMLAVALGPAIIWWVKEFSVAVR